MSGAPTVEWLYLTRSQSQIITFPSNIKKLIHFNGDFFFNPYFVDLISSLKVL